MVPGGTLMNFALMTRKGFLKPRISLTPAEFIAAGRRGLKN
jgi:hypothetical protein